MMFFSMRSERFSLLKIKREKYSFCPLFFTIKKGRYGFIFSLEMNRSLNNRERTVEEPFNFTPLNSLIIRTRSLYINNINNIYNINNTTTKRAWDRRRRRFVKFFQKGNKLSGEILSRQLALRDSIGCVARFVRLRCKSWLVSLSKSADEVARFDSWRCWNMEIKVLK